MKQQISMSQMAIASNKKKRFGGLETLAGPEAL